MPSSTSNSSIVDRKIPTVAWKGTFAATTLIVVAFFAFAEFAMRGAGFIPSIIDDPAMWSLSREKIYDSNSIVLVGASRILIGFDKSGFTGTGNDSNIVYLAVPSLTNSFSTLRDIADDEKFTGTAIVSIHKSSFSKSTLSEQEKYTSYYHNEWSLNKKLNRIFATYFQENLVSVQSHLNLPRIAHKSVGNYTSSILAPPFATTKNDRSIRADYNMDTEVIGRIHSQHYHETLSTIEQDEEDKDGILSTIDMYNACANKIRARGGDVIFLRMPSGDCGELENNSKHGRWVFSTLASRLDHTFIDAYQWPTLAAFPSLDCSHLDFRDSKRFTEQLSSVLVFLKNAYAKQAKQ